MNDIVQAPERPQKEVPEARVMDVGFVGLGRMGSAVAGRLLDWAVMALEQVRASGPASRSL